MVPPKKYGLAHTNYDDNFVFDGKIYLITLGAIFEHFLPLLEGGLI